MVVLVKDVWCFSFSPMNRRWYKLDHFYVVLVIIQVLIVKESSWNSSISNRSKWLSSISNRSDFPNMPLMIIRNYDLHLLDIMNFIVSFETSLLVNLCLNQVCFESSCWDLREEWEGRWFFLICKWEGHWLYGSQNSLWKPSFLWDFNRVVWNQVVNPVWVFV